MLQLLDAIGPKDRPALRDALMTHVAAVRAATPRSDRTLVARAEASVRRDPQGSFRFAADGAATLHAAGRTFCAGRFETPTLGELRARAAAARAEARGPAAQLRFWVLDGASPATDIGALQATSPAGSLFQVASQYNCLEATGASVVDVAAYFGDSTQGPRAAISAFPGVLLRHYAAPSEHEGRFVQSTAGPQIELLRDVCDAGVASVTSGYLLTHNIPRPTDFARLLDARFDSLRVGVHDEVEVVLGGSWDGPVPQDHGIAQVTTSTVAGGGYSDLDTARPEMASIVRSLQRAANLGTLLAAAALGKSYVTLTLIGGGVFGNPVGMIWDAILWALHEVEPLLHRDLVVVLNGYSIGPSISEESLRDAAMGRGGALVRFRGDTITIA